MYANHALIVMLIWRSTVRDLYTLISTCLWLSCINKLSYFSNWIVYLVILNSGKITVITWEKGELCTSQVSVCTRTVSYRDSSTIFSWCSRCDRELILFALHDNKFRQIIDCGVNLDIGLDTWYLTWWHGRNASYAQQVAGVVGVAVVVVVAEFGLPMNTSPAY